MGHKVATPSQLFRDCWKPAEAPSARSHRSASDASTARSSCTLQRRSANGLPPPASAACCTIWLRLRCDSSPSLPYDSNTSGRKLHLPYLANFCFSPFSAAAALASPMPFAVGCRTLTSTYCGANLPGHCSTASIFATSHSGIGLPVRATAPARRRRYNSGTWRSLSHVPPAAFVSLAKTSSQLRCWRWSRKRQWAGCQLPGSSLWSQGLPLARGIWQDLSSVCGLLPRRNWVAMRHCEFWRCSCGAAGTIVHMLPVPAPPALIWIFACIVVSSPDTVQAALASAAA